MASNAIDSNRAEQSVSLLNGDEKQDYQPKTLQQHNMARRVYLPIFPTESFDSNPCLLLANVPITHLGPYEIARRHYGAYTSEALMLMNNYDFSDMNGFSLSQQDAEELRVRLQVGMSIITFNADQLRGICYSLLALHGSFRQNILLEEDVVFKEPTLNSKQMAIALEFFLQIDVDMFYMKTCSFRGAEPQLKNIEGLFCGKDGPEARYASLPCGNRGCPCCDPPAANWEENQALRIVGFVPSSMHQFINGYTTYLNCPATCNTSNVIYAMTCPCGLYDYVDSTRDTLADAMIYHRHHGNRIIHKTLTGCSLYPGISLDPSEKENETANMMRLYQHAARCPVALRLFLDFNPSYWCFIPMLFEDAQVINMTDIQGNSSSASSSSYNGNRELASSIATGPISLRKLARYIDRVPLPPAKYAFSNEQRQQQHSFFQHFLPSNIDELPYVPVDLCKVELIVVLPDDHSIILRYIIETLFIIHGETRLNMICPIGRDPEKRYGQPYQCVWCTNLNRPFVVTPISTQ